MKIKFDKNWFCCNTANAITVLGITLCQVIKVIIFINAKWVDAIFWVAVAVAGTDWFDGRVARHFEKMGYESITSFGKAADRFRDKDYALTTLLFLIWHPMGDYRLKWFLCPLVIAEIILLATLCRAVKKKTDASATDWGKWKMASECFVILAGLAIIVAKMHGIKVAVYITYPVLSIALIAAFLATMSIKNHIADFYKSVQT